MSSFLNVVLKGSLESCPFAPRKKPILPEIGSALISGGASLLGNLLGFGSSNKANETNMEIARMNADLQRETNKQNYQIFKEQNAFNLDMWNKQNLYNSPSAQVGRLLAAGINPSAVFGSGSVSEAGSLQSASPAAMVAPQLGNTWQPFTPDFSGVGNAALQAIAMKNQSRVSESQANFNDAKAEYEWLSLASRLQQDLANAKKGSVEYEYAKRNLEFFNETYSAQKRTIENTAEQSESNVAKTILEIESMKIQKELLSLDLKWKDKLNAASLSSINAGIKQSLAAAYNYETSSIVNIAEEAVKRAQKDGLDISNSQAEQLKTWIVDKAKTEARVARDEEFYRAMQEADNARGKGAQFTPNVSNLRRLNSYINKKYGVKIGKGL